MILTWKDVVQRATDGNPEPPRRVEKSDAQWQRQLPPDVYRVTRRSATERPGTSELCELFEPGKYSCACCGTMLFDAQLKFESGTGWPSFSQPVDNDAVAYKRDDTHGMTRIETVCNVCDAHLGHVFPDGPEPSGLRYCINGVALQKVAADDD